VSVLENIMLPQSLAWVRVCAYCTPTRVLLAWVIILQKQVPCLLTFDTSDGMVVLFFSSHKHRSIYYTRSRTSATSRFGALSPASPPRGIIRNNIFPRIPAKLHRNISASATGERARIATRKSYGLGICFRGITIGSWVLYST